MSLLQPNMSQTYSTVAPISGTQSALPLLWQRLEAYWGTVQHLFKMFLLVCLVAIPAGLTGIAFRCSVSWTNDFRTHHPFLIWSLPLAGLLIATLYRFCRVSHRGEINLILDATDSNDSPAGVSPWLTPLVFVASILSHLCGASVGAEGASLILGGGVGVQCARFFNVTGRDCGMLIFCAMAGAFAPLLGTPIAAAVFVLERSHSHRYLLILPCLIASWVAYTLSLSLGLEPLRFETLVTPEFALENIFALRTLVAIMLLAGACITVGRCFHWILNYVKNWTDRAITNRYCAMFAGGVAILFVTLALGTQNYSGTGMTLISSAVGGTATNWAFGWKILLTALALGVGFKGGQIVPAFCVGAIFGCVIAPFLGMNACFGAALGMIALFVVVVRCPITAVLIAVEIFPFTAVGWFLIITFLCTLPKIMASLSRITPHP